MEEPKPKPILLITPRIRPETIVSEVRRVLLEHGRFDAAHSFMVDIGRHVDFNNRAKALIEVLDLSEKYITLRCS